MVNYAVNLKKTFIMPFPEDGEEGTHTHIFPLKAYFLHTNFIRPINLYANALYLRRNTCIFPFFLLEKDELKR